MLVLVLFALFCGFFGAFSGFVRVGAGFCRLSRGGLVVFSLGAGYLLIQRIKNFSEWSGKWLTKGGEVW